MFASSFRPIAGALLGLCAFSVVRCNTPPVESTGGADSGAGDSGASPPTSGDAGPSGQVIDDGGSGADTSIALDANSTDASSTVLGDASVGDGGSGGVTFSANPNNVLSVIATVVLPGYASARVVSSNANETLTTPSVTLDANGNGRIPVLGLAPSTAYSHVVEMTTAAGATATTDAVALTTPALPSTLADVVVNITPITASPESGYFYVTGASPVDFAFDSTGTIRYYYQNGGSELVESKMQYDGTYTSYIGNSTGSEAVPGTYVRFTPDGTQIASYSVATPEVVDGGGSLSVYTDPHELWITSDATGAEHLHFFGYEELPLDADASTVAWHQLVRQSPSGDVEFRWKSSSRFTVADRLETDLPYDLDHANSIAIDPIDGNYVVSLRCLDAIVKLDYDTGAVLWQLGGVQGQFTILNDPLGGFYGQHSVRVLANGNILLYDNGVGHSPPESRAAEYALDTTAMTATLVWEYRRTPIIETEFVGSVERQSTGNTLVAFAYAGVVDEADTTGNAVWEATILTGTTARIGYRVRRLPSLYTYVVP